MKENSSIGIESYSPKEIAQQIENIGVVKANLPFLSLVILGVLAGGFIAIGALASNLVTSDTELSFAVSRFLSGLVFSTGLILVILAGAELFTGNNLLVMAWISKRITGLALLRNLLLTFISNFVGAFGMAVLVDYSRHGDMAGGSVGANIIKTACFKVSLPFQDAFFKGILCNILVCLAVWIASGSRSVGGKIAAIIFPVSIFVAAGFEHSIANMYFISLGMISRGKYEGLHVQGMDQLNWQGLFYHLLPVTLGNLIGGGVLVGLVYFIVYRRRTRKREIS